MRIFCRVFTWLKKEFITDLKSWVDRFDVLKKKKWKKKRQDGYVLLRLDQHIPGLKKFRRPLRSSMWRHRSRKPLEGKSRIAYAWDLAPREIRSDSQSWRQYGRPKLMEDHLYHSFSLIASIHSFKSYIFTKICRNQWSPPTQYRILKYGRQTFALPVASWKL